MRVEEGSLETPLYFNPVKPDLKYIKVVDTGIQLYSQPRLHRNQADRC
jgi:hypothetical protein